MLWFKKISAKNLLIIARGPSGAGKSTMVRELSNQLNNAPVFSTDEYFMKNGIYEFGVQSLGTAHKWNQDRVADALEKKVPVVIIDNTNITAREMKPYVEMGLKHGYSISFREPNWHPELKTLEGKWNVDFLQKLQENSDRTKQKKSLDRDIIQRMVDRYEYSPTIEKILQEV